MRCRPRQTAKLQVAPRRNTRRTFCESPRKGLANARRWKHRGMLAAASTRARLGWAFPTTFALAVALGFGIGAAYAASSTPAPNTVLARFSGDLDTRTVRPGQELSLEIVPPFPSGDVSYEGASVRGHVAGVVPPAHGHGARLALAFDEILLPSGAGAPIAGHARARAGSGIIEGNIFGRWVGLTPVGRSEFIVQRGSTVRVHVDQTAPRPPRD
jgi:hypothetical protein